MKIVKNYLTSEELGFIIEEVNKHDSLLEKEIVKVGIVAQFCIDEFNNKENSELSCNDIYDKIVSDEIYDELYKIRNYGIIDACTVSTIAILDSITNRLEETIDNIPKDYNLESMVNALKSVEELKEVIK